MNKITSTEKYALCMLKDVKKFNNMELSAHIIVSMIVEMILEGSLELVDKDKKKKWEIIPDIDVKLGNRLPKEEYNRELYKNIEEINKPKIGIAQIIEKVCFSFTDKKYKEIIKHLQDKMINDKLISLEKKKVLLKEKEVIVLNENEFSKTIGEIRTEFLGNEVYTDEFTLLVSLLNSTNFLKSIFIKYEKETLKKRVKEIKQTEIYKQVYIARTVIDQINADAMIIMS